MSDKSDAIPSLNGVELHYVLQDPAVRAVFDDMMRLKAEAQPTRPGYAAVHDCLQLVGAEWFRISREAAEALPPEKRGR